MAWCRQATSHYQSQCWPRSMSPYGFIRPQWVNIIYCYAMGHLTLVAITGTITLVSYLGSQVTAIHMKIRHQLISPTCAWSSTELQHYLSQCWPRFMSPYGVTRPQWVTILRLGVPHMHHWYGSSLVQVGASWSFSAKPLPGAILSHCPQEKKSLQNRIIFVSTKGISRCHEQNISHFLAFCEGDQLVMSKDVHQKWASNAENVSMLRPHHDWPYLVSAEIV